MAEFINSSLNLSKLQKDSSIIDLSKSLGSLYSPVNPLK